MPAPTTIDELLDLVRKSGLVEDKRLDGYLRKLGAAGPATSDVAQFVGLLVRDAILTQFQAEQLLLGKWRRFHIGKYKVLEKIGSGGMGNVYLCEHTLMRRRVAVKVLPVAKSDDSSAKDRFLREARAVAALDHPNIVRAYDIDQDGNLHFLVMEYVDGSNLQEIVRCSGPLDVLRAVHYAAQAGLALQHALEVAAIVHRDIKPGNVLVDRNGVVKVLDMGLARFFHDEEDLLTQKYDENVLGTADYLAPEQALDSHSVDIRADIYSLGATFYFCLTGKAPFSEGTVAQKLIWHQTRQPKALRAQRPEVPETLAAIVEKMMAKDPNQRYQTPIEIVEALAPWTQTAIPPPPESEMPQLSPAATGGATSDPGSASAVAPTAVGSPSKVRKVWQVPASPAPKPASGPAKPPPPGMGERKAAPNSDPTAQQGQAALARPVAGNAAAPELVPWEQLAADTQDALVQADTVPHQGRPRRSTHAQTASHWDRIQQLARKPAVLWGAGGTVAGLVLIIVLWNVLGRGGAPKTGPAAPTGPQVLRVHRSAAGQPNTYATLRDALGRARRQDRVLVFDEVIEERLILIDAARLAADVVLESGLEGKPITWRLPSHLQDDEPLLKINGVEGLRIRGFVLDGRGRARDLVALSGVCPGLVLEDVQLRGFTERAVVFKNCEGRSDRPVHLTRLRITRTDASQTGLLFDALPRVRAGVNQYIVITDCRVDGGGETGGILMTSPTVIRDVRFERSPAPEPLKPSEPPIKK